MRFPLSYQGSVNKECAGTPVARGAASHLSILSGREVNAALTRTIRRLREIRP
jgi:hypothetical protein